MTNKLFCLREVHNSTVSHLYGSLADRQVTSTHWTNVSVEEGGLRAPDQHNLVITSAPLPTCRLLLETSDAPLLLLLCFGFC